jgi:hypothetical protein
VLRLPRPLHLPPCRGWPEPAAPSGTQQRPYLVPGCHPAPSSARHSAAARAGPLLPPRLQVKAETEGEQKINNSYQGLYKQMVEAMRSFGVEAVSGARRRQSHARPDATLRCAALPPLPPGRPRPAAAPAHRPPTPAPRPRRRRRR